VTNEETYDKVIAPLLLEAVGECRSAGLPMLAVVQYGPESFGETYWFGESPELTMQMLRLCLAANGNLDRFIVGLAKYCHQHNISTDASMVLRKVLSG
jgi:hypothetical protein